ncbi:TPA: single-stranded DNA-binding protein [bacterium]|jgi:single-strand DNA-binding protein|nr:single-stranded DNA-binding protein [bacterium]
MINRVVLVGRLTRDPELRTVGANNSKVCSFTLAVDSRFRGQDGQRTADFIPCVLWNRPAEVLAQYARKGSLIGIEGRIQTRNYENKEGNRVFVVEVLCDSMQLLGSRNQEDTSRGYTQDYDYGPSHDQEYEPSYEQESSHQSVSQPSSRGITINDDDLPF